MVCYFYLIYWPTFGSNYDILAPVFINPTRDTINLFYATASRPPNFTSDGRAIFTELGTLGTNPTTGPWATTRTQLYVPNGYYFVQTSETSYDMVNVADSKIWITWEF